MQTLIVKVGTNVITQSNGLLDLEILKSLVEQLVRLREAGHRVILVSSGAMGAGRSLIKLSENSDNVTQRQVLAAVGQAELIHHYLTFFGAYKKVCAQVLATKEDFRGRAHYLNMKNCFDGLLSEGVIPVVNENDVVSVDELMFTDNDELAGMIASMVNADRLILLTCVDGIYSGHPEDSSSEILHHIGLDEDVDDHVAPTRSSFGRGGMLTKIRMAKKLGAMGIQVHIAHGQKPHILEKILSNEKIGTSFEARPKKKSNMKRWIAHSEGYEKGVITINQCAEDVLKEKIASLLPVGVVKVEGEFEKGDVLRIQNEAGQTLGFGIASTGHETAHKQKGEKEQKALIHYDYLFLES